MIKSKWAARRMGALWVGMSTAWLAACGGGGGGGGGSNGSGATTGPVITSQAGPVNVTLPTYGGYEYWMAYQDGDGPWKLATRSNGAFSFQVDDKAGKYAVMLVEESSSPATADVPPTVLAYHLTRAEVSGIDLRQRRNPGRTDYTTVPVKLSGAPATGQCTVALGSESSLSGACDTLGARPVNAPMDKMDGFAVHVTDGGVADSLVIQRDLDLRSVKSVSFDFTQAIALPAPSQTSTLTDYVPIVGETLSRSASLVSPTSQIRLAQGSQLSLSYPLVPAGALRNDDAYVVSASGRLTQGNVTARRSARYQSTSGVAQPLKLPPYANPLALGIAPTGTSVRPTMAWTPVSGSLMTNVFVWEPTGMSPALDFTYSAGWNAGARTVSYTAPDLTGLGWKPSWNLRRQTQMTVYYTEVFNSRPTPNFYVGTPPGKVEDQTSWFTQFITDVTIP